MTKCKKISDEKLQKAIGWSPFKPKRHEPQIEILKSEAKNMVISAGRGFGKSALCAYLALKTLLMDDKQICLVAPTYDLTQRVLDYIDKWLAKSFPSIPITYRPFPQIRTLWGSQLDCKSTENPTGILGKRYNLVIVDEASKTPRKIYESYIFPLTQIKNGRTIFISTPFGKNWFYNVWLDVKETGGAFQYKSIDNPYFPKEDWERAREKLPEQVFKQEYLAQFLEDAASVFRGIKEIISDDCLEDVQNHKYILGVDLGKHEDFTVITVLDKYNHKVVYFERFKKIDWNLQKDRIIAASKRYNNARIIIDSTGLGDPISDDLKHQGLIVDDFKISGKSKQQLIDKLSIYIDQKAITIPPEEELIDELESFGYQLSDSGNIKYSAPSGLHDDCVISLALAVWGLMSPKTQNPNRLYRPELKCRKRFQYF